MENENRLPKWLVKTQLGSWEPEIFISGIVLFGLITIPNYLYEFRDYFSREIFGLSTDIENTIAVLVTGIDWMIFGLVLHLFFRGIWIGLVGLSYVFPKGINKQRLGYKDQFNNVIDKIPNVTDQIIKLEKISSSIFSINYLMFMCIIGAYLFIVISIVAPIYLFILFTDFTVVDAFAEETLLNKSIGIYGRVMMTIGGIYMFDFVTLGLVKRIKYVNKIYFPFYKAISFITFSSLYRNIYYLLISNFSKWKTISFLVVFVIITLFMVGLNASRGTLDSSFSQLEFYEQDEKSFINPRRYDNMNSVKNQWISIQSDVVKDDFLKLFISSRVMFKDSIKAVCDTTIQEKESAKYKLACIKNFYKVLINDSTVNVDKWFFHKHPKTNNRGVITYLDVSNLPHGMNSVEVRIENWVNEQRGYIPFYLDR